MNEEYLMTLIAVLVKAGQVIKPEAVISWMGTPNDLLDGERPLALVQRGDAETVFALIDALAEGVVM